MVCVAAFIILCIIGIFVAILSIFKRDIGRRYWKVFSKSLGCVGRKVTLQKCETGFKDDVKNTLLSRVIIKHPKWVKPLSWLIEIASIIIVAITIWSLIIAVKSLLALWALGTCNVQQPAKCSLGAETCSIDSSEPKNIVEYIERKGQDWAEIFTAIPDKFRSFETTNFEFEGISVPSKENNKTAVDILDPGCLVCLQSFRAQLHKGFFDNYSTKIIPYAITQQNGKEKFPNSTLIVKYLFATEEVSPEDHVAYQIIKKIFTEKDDKNVIYQTTFSRLDNGAAEKLIKKWLRDFKLNEKEIKKITKVSRSKKIQQKIDKNNDIIKNQLHAKGIPTLIYDNKKHTGLYKD